MSEQIQDKTKPKAEVIFRMEIGGKLVDLNAEQVEELYQELMKWFDKIRSIRDQMDKLLPESNQETPVVNIPSVHMDYPLDRLVPTTSDYYYYYDYNSTVPRNPITTSALISDTIASITNTGEGEE